MEDAFAGVPLEAGAAVEADGAVDDAEDCCAKQDGAAPRIAPIKMEQIEIKNFMMLFPVS